VVNGEQGGEGQGGGGGRTRWWRVDKVVKGGQGGG
jgi:hypothetical protein